MIDLHTHSTASDGTLSPGALVDLAAEKGLMAISLTDHDTVAGVAAAWSRGVQRGVQIIPGLELGIRWHGPGQMHLLGYNFRYHDAELQQRLGWLCMHRRDRARQIVAKLNALGIPVSMQRIEEIAGKQSIGRPHVARALLEAGSVASVGEAFQLYLSPGRPAYIDKEDLSPKEAIELIRRCSGIAVLAHPATLKLDAQGLFREVRELMGYGLRGIEVYWSGHAAEQMNDYLQLASRLELLVTGGSDFHGENKPGVELGTGRNNNVQVPDGVLESLLASGSGPVRPNFATSTS